MIITRWYRVKKNRLCEICRKPDWCTWADGGISCCMRVENSSPMKNGGFLYKSESPRPYIAPAIRAAIQDPPLDADGLWRRWFARTEREHLDGFAITLGVDTDALRSIGCAWADREWQLDKEKIRWATPAWCFPMRDPHGRVIGIRLRADGQKWAVKGSRSGLFIPTDDDSAITEFGTLWLVEGPTDLSAALTIGLAAIGRPSARSQQEMILEYIHIWKVKRVVIVTDNDVPDERGQLAGHAGALKLQEELTVPSVILIPPTKDLREFVNYGGDYLTAQSMIADLVWQCPAA